VSPYCLLIFQSIELFSSAAYFSPITSRPPLKVFEAVVSFIGETKLQRFLKIKEPKRTDI
jgi:hypothetical protein